MANAKVTLNVMKLNGGSTPIGWKVSPTNSDFVYKFTGGNTGENNGDISFPTDRIPKKIKFELADSVSDRFTIYNIGFFNWDRSLSTDFERAKVKRRKASVIDDDGESGGGHFKVWLWYQIEPNLPPYRLECDPRWENQNPN